MQIKSRCCITGVYTVHGSICVWQVCIDGVSIVLTLSLQLSKIVLLIWLVVGGHQRQRVAEIGSTCRSSIQIKVKSVCVYVCVDSPGRSEKNEATDSKTRREVDGRGKKKRLGEDWANSRVACLHCIATKVPMPSECYRQDRRRRIRRRRRKDRAQKRVFVTNEEEHERAYCACCSFCFLSKSFVFLLMRVLCTVTFILTHLYSLGALIYNSSRPIN